MEHGAQAVAIAAGRGEGRGDAGCGADQHLRAGKPGRGEATHGTVGLFGQQAAVGLAHAVAAPGQPCERGAAGRHRLVHPGLGRKFDAGTGLGGEREEFRVLAAGLAQRQAEATAGEGRRRQAHQHVAGIAGADLAANPDGTGRMEVGALHPVRRRRAVDRLDRAEHDIGAALAHRRHQLLQPVGRCRLVVVDEGQEFAAAMVEAGIACDRDVRCRAMDIVDREGDLRAQSVDQAGSARHGIVVGDDDAHRAALGHRKRGERAQRPLQFRAPVGADRDVDQRERQWRGGGSAHGVTCACVKDEADRRRGESSSRQKPADQAKCMIIAETAASGP